MFTQTPQMGRQYTEDSFYTNQAHNLFWKRYSGGRLHALGAALSGRPRHLQPLSDTIENASVEGRHYAGLQLVALETIRGSENRSDQFDAAFRPLHRHMVRRWASVAAAWLAGVVFAPVELIQVGDSYYVRDGHHRISVARAVGQRYIDAEVTVWKLDAQRQQTRQAGQPSTRCHPAHAC